MESVIKKKLFDISEGKLSVVDNVNNFLNVIKNKNPKINAFIYVMEKEAIKHAKKIDEKIKRGEKIGKLAGLVIGVKANIRVLDAPLSCGSKTLENYYAEYDADVIARIKDEDGIIIGLTNMDEFACGNTGETSAFGLTLNPKYPLFNPGGSSSGSASAIAAEMCDIALGSDTGGSIRTPANNCGVVGIKPTKDKISVYGLINLSRSLDVIGPLCSDVYGCALMIEVLSSYKENEDLNLDINSKKYFDKNKLQEIKIGIFKDLSNLEINDKIRKISEKICEKLNGEVIDIEFEYFDMAVKIYYDIVYKEFFEEAKKFDGVRYDQDINSVGGIEVLKRFLDGKSNFERNMVKEKYKKAIEKKNLIFNKFKIIFNNIDFIFMPVLPNVPSKLGVKLNKNDSYYLDILTIPSSLVGVPSGVLPCKLNNLNNPQSLQIVASWFEERKLFNIMNYLEKKEFLK